MEKRESNVTDRDWPVNIEAACSTAVSMPTANNLGITDFLETLESYESFGIQADGILGKKPTTIGQLFG